MHTYDVLVIGAGPAGLATALSAVRHGASVLVVERRPDTSTHPRATGITTRTMEILRAWGLSREVRAAGMALPSEFGTARTLAEPLLGPPTPLGYPDARDALAVSPAYPALLAQDLLEPMLAREVGRHGGEIRFGTRLTGLEAGPSGVTARLTGGGATTSVAARFVVGADGSRSTVRRMLGIDVEHLGRLGDYVSVLFRADLGPPTLPLVRITHPDASGLLVAVDGERWVYSLEYEPGLGASPAEFPPERWRDLLRLATGRPDLHPELLSVMAFGMAGELATALRSGAGFLVGDAAHRMTPIGGIGMNTAIHDGHNLGWKLAWCARGLAGEALLASYAAERGPVARRNTLRTLQPESREAAGGLDRDLGPTYRSAVIASDEPEVAGFAPRGRPGERAPHLWLATPAGRRSTLDLFDGGLTLLTGSVGRAWRRAAAVAGPGVPVDVPVTTPDDADRLAAALGIDPSGAVLVRPDGYVAWRCRTAATDPGAALGRALRTTLGLAATPARRAS